MVLAFDPSDAGAEMRELRAALHIAEEERDDARAKLLLAERALAQHAPPEVPEGMTPLTIQMKPLLAQYVQQRAAMHGQTPEDHAVRILLDFKAHHDTNPPGRANRQAERNGGPVVNRK